MILMCELKLTHLKLTCVPPPRTNMRKNDMTRACDSVLREQHVIGVNHNKNLEEIHIKMITKSQTDHQ